VGEALEPSLLMSFLLVTLGTVAAAHDGYFSLAYYLLAIVGVTLAQNAVNVLNDFHDYRTGVDVRTVKTPFSGGSKYLVNGLIKPESAFVFGTASLLFAAAAGAYLIWVRGFLLLPIILFAGASVYFYTTSFARIYLGELLAGLNLGPLVVVGAYFVQAIRFNLGSLAVGLAPGIMIANVLFLNEFPDVKADAAAGRKNLPILLGRKGGARLYAFLEVAALAWVVVSSVSGLTPLTTMIALASVPFAAKAISGALRHSENTERLVPALGANVLTAYLTMALLSIGYVLAGTVVI
jgi:1,4-dihydroxy-2-naphthoate octaprenyltransferase